LSLPVDEFFDHYNGIAEVVRMIEGEDVSELRLRRQDRNIKRIERHYVNRRR